jgi:hypothetical protein
MSHSIYSPSTSPSGKYVGYDRVEERLESGSDQNGYTVSWYQNEPDIQETNVENMPLIRHDQENGLLLREAYYKNADLTPTRETIYSYSYDELPCYWGMLPFFKSRVFYGNASSLFFYVNRYTIGFYPIKRLQPLLLSKIDSIYDAGGKWGSKERYTYDGYNKTKSIVKENSQGQTSEVALQYPYDVTGDPVAATMVADNVISPYLFKEEKLDGTLVEQEKISYRQIKQHMPFGVTYRSYDVGLVQQRRQANEAYTTRFNFQRYDDDRLLQYVGEDGVTVCYVWGYNKEYVVAKVVGATYQEVVALVDLNILNAATSEQALLMELDKIRAGLPEAMVVTYTHSPLVGLSTETDVTGRSRKYLYESDSKRLKNIYNHDGHVLQSFQYNFYKP